MSRPVTVQYYKYPDVLHWRHELTLLGDDRHGTWLGATVGTVVQRGMEPPRTMRRYFVQLISPESWWTALFNGPNPDEMEVYVDVTTPPVWPDPGRVEMIDLDLDVVRRVDGTVYVDDEDEFEEHRVSLGYPPAMADMARTVAARLAIALEQRRPPFDEEATTWLEMVSG